MRSIELFVAAYEEQSFTAAAVRANATQSGVSQHIRRIEQRFGVRLFDRVGGAVVPTAAGTRYYGRCIELLRLREIADCELGDAAQALSGAITVGLMPTVCARALMPALVEIERQHPLVTVNIAEGYSHDLVRRVQAGELDFAVVPAGPDVAGIRAKPMLKVSELVVGASGSIDVSWRHRHEPIKIVLPGPLNARHQTILTYLQVNEIAVARVMTLDSMIGTLDLVARTDWIAILPELLFAKPDDGNLATCPLCNPPLLLDLMCIEPAARPLSRAGSIFFEMLRAAAADLCAPAGKPVP